MPSSHDLHPPTVAIIGAGASGTLAAIHLLRRARQPFEVVLFDRLSAPGHGIAYGSEVEAHLLNVRAGNMSGLPDEPRHFVDWLHQADVGDEWRVAVPTDFVPRQLYARYLEATLRAAQASATSGVRLTVRQEEVTALAPDQRTLALDGGATLTADRSVLALGNFLPQPLLGYQAPSDSGVYDDPWAAASLDGLDPASPVLLVGTGLTMIDVVVSLVLERRHTGPISAVSRRGLLPRVHGGPGGYTRAWVESELPSDTLGLLRRVRQEVGVAAEAGHDWRGVVDSLRPVTQALWQRASAGERERFLRHVQPYWDTHRHRIAPRIGRVVAEVQATGQLSVRAGRVTRIEPGPTGVRVDVAARRGGHWSTDVARVINCTGPAVNVNRLNDPLVASLLAGGLVRPDALNLGLATTAEGRLVDASGSPTERLFTLGPMRRGELWETTAVPDIRAQAARLGEVLLGELRN
jgi:uncharacterized NAD(P)/FAD-binding protein YdhS